MAESTLRQLDLPITGMTCANCAQTVERTLNKTAGVENANVNFATERAHVEYDPVQVDMQTLIQRVSKAGYGVAEAKIELPITGMTCASCVNNVERAIRKQAGVMNVNVNLATEKATINYLPGSIRRGDLVKAVEKAGYGVLDLTNAEIPEDAERAARQAEIDRQQLMVIIGAAFTIPLFVVSMARDLYMASLPSMGGHAMAVEGNNPALNWLLWSGWPFIFGLLATPVQVIVGRQYIVGAWKALRNRSANMDTLIAMGSLAAYGYSIVVLLGIVGGVQAIIGDHVYFETAAVILTLITLGKLLEARAKGRTSEAIKSLMNLAPKTAHLLRDDAEIEVPADEVLIGDRVVVRPGERVPVDGVVIEGRSAVDEAMITGESLPVNKSAGSPIIGATINKQGRLIVEATAVGSQTALANIIRMVEQAQGSKAPIQRMADRVSGVFVPVVIALAAATFLGWLVIGQVGFVEAMIHTVAVLVIACPCALGLATPTAIMVGTGKGAEMGILFKSSEALENAQRLNIIALDKTGTITNGEPAVTEIIPLNGFNEADLMRLAAGGERGSEHPLAQAVVAKAIQMGITVPQPQSFNAESGRGVIATVEGQHLLIGSSSYLREEGVDLNPYNAQIEAMQAKAQTAVLVAADSKLIGMIGIADTIKATSREAVAAMQAMGLEVVMITGDNHTVAETIAGEVGIKRVLAEVLPGQKAEAIASLQQGSAQKVAMVGDGINDAPALAQADVGIAIGTGTDVAIEASDVTLVSGDLRAVARALSLSKATMRTIYQNLFWALIYNIILIPVAMLGLLVPILAAGAMAFSSVFVVLNSLRLGSPSSLQLKAHETDTLRMSHRLQDDPTPGFQNPDRVTK